MKYHCESGQRLATPTTNARDHGAHQGCGRRPWPSLRAAQFTENESTPVRYIAAGHRDGAIDTTRSGDFVCYICARPVLRSGSPPTARRHLTGFSHPRRKRQRRASQGAVLTSMGTGSSHERGQQTAVHRQGCSRDPRGVVGGEEDTRPADVTGGAEPRKRRTFSRRLDLLLG